MTHLHFETRAKKAAVFRITAESVEAAAKRAKAGRTIRRTIGEDLKDLSWLRTAEGLTTHNDVVNDPAFPKANLADAAPKLRWIHVTGAGIEPLLPLTWLPKHVTLTNNSGVHVQKTGEYAMMSLLAAYARLPQMVTQHRAGIWNQLFTPSIAGKTLVVVGLGDMGGAAAKAGRKLGMTVIGIRRTPRPYRYADEMLATKDLKKALARADVVYIAAPLTPETHHLIDAAALAAMKPGASLINVGRAPVVDYVALEQALRGGHLSGAILDVFEPEPLPASSPLWQVPNLIITPHCSSDDLDAYLPLTLDLVFLNAARLREGRRLKNAVNPATGY